MKVNKTSKKKGNKFQIFVLIIVFLISILIQKIPILENSFKDHEDVRFIKQSDNNPLSYAWNRTWGGLDTEYGKTIAIDSSNNIFVGGFTKSYSSNYDACLIKYDTNGALLWNRTWGGNDMDRCFDIVVDPSDNIYMVGSTLSFGEGSRDFFLVKYNNSGSLLWNRTWGDITSEICYALALDSSNNLYLAGDIGGSSRTDIIVAKFNASGDYLWNCTWKGIFESSCSDISIDNLGNIYIAGSIGNSYNEFLLLKYSSSGDYVWNRTWSGPESSYTAYGLDIDSFDNVYIGGYANNDWCLVKFNTTGDCLWSRTWGGAHQDIPFALAIDSLDNIYIGGHLKTSVMEAVMCVASFSSKGDFQWYQTWEGGESSACYDICFDVLDNIYLGGDIFEGEDKDIVLVKYNIFIKIQIITPVESQFFGFEAPKYDIRIHGNIPNTVWYSVNNGENYTITDLNGSIDQDIWNGCDEGTIKISFYANNSRGFFSFRNVFIWKDLTPPNITILSPLQNQVFGNITPSFQINIDELHLNATCYSIEGGDNITFSEFHGKINQTVWDTRDNGSVSIKFYAIDYLGYVGVKEVVVVKDLYTPSIHVYSPIENQVFGLKSPKYNVSISSLILNTTWYSLNDGANYTFTDQVGTVNQTEWNSCENGSNIITFYANNSAGKISFKKITIFKDTSIPNITINKPYPFQIFGNRTFDYNISINISDYDNIWYSLNDGPIYYGSGLLGPVNQESWDSCDNGSVNLKFYVNNSVGNIADKEIIIYKDESIEHLKEAYAIIIGIENYPGSSNDLSYCKDDAISIRYYLQEESNFKTENIIFLTDSAATFSNINDAFTQIQSKIYLGDIFFFYYSGHGGRNGGGEFICPYDSVPDNPSSYFYDDLLDTQIDNLGVEESYIIIDACNSGGMIPEVQDSGVFIMSACRGNEYSYETPGLRHGVFTYYFLQAINYPSSDSNGDGIISLEEQFAYAMPRTQSYVSGLGGSQTPQLYDGIEGYSVIYPIFGSISFTIIENILDFSFNFYGHGSISVLNITVCSLIPNVVVKSWNLLQGWGSVNGFGYNNGSVELIQGNITGFELIAMVQGNSLKTLTFSFGDSDKDGLEDLFEILEGNGTDPSLFDTDFDGLNDYEEFYGITDPTINDTDGDGMTDGYEINNDLDPINNDTTLDFDNDGLLNILEFQLGTIANNSDTDSDNIPDGWEYENGLNISFNDGNVDLDNDDLTNLMEYTYRTDPWLNDTDGDGWGDGDEILIYNTDPLDPNNFPQFNQNNNLALFIAAIVSPITIVGISLYFIRYKKKRE